MEFLGIGYQEMVLVLVLALVFVGPERLPTVAYQIGRAVRTLQRYARVVRDEFSEEFEYIDEQYRTVRGEIDTTRQTLRDEQRRLEAEMREGQARFEADVRAGESEGGETMAAPAGGESPTPGAQPTPPPAVPNERGADPSSRPPLVF